MATWVKFCGCRCAQDVELAISAGADAFGMIFAPSPRAISLEEAQVIARCGFSSIVPVGVFVNPSREDVEAVRGYFPNLVVQLSGEETPEFVAALPGTVIKAIHVDSATESPETIGARCAAYAGATILFDTRVAGTRGGSGQRFAWNVVAPIVRARRCIVAGGLTPENVGECVRTLRPFGVDVRSGIETDGRKDASKMTLFARAAREFDAA